MNINMENYYSTRKNVFERIQDASTATKLLMSLLMACFTGIIFFKGRLTIYHNK